MAWKLAHHSRHRRRTAKRAIGLNPIVIRASAVRRPDDKRRMSREVHARFRESAAVGPHCTTRPVRASQPPQSNRKRFLIVDRHPVHRSRKTRKWIDEHAAEIRLIFLPASSPDLDPDEMLDQDVKSNAVRKRRLPTLPHRIDNVRSCLRSRQRQKAVVRRYLSIAIRPPRRTLNTPTVLLLPVVKKAGPPQAIHPLRAVRRIDGYVKDLLRSR